MHRDVKPSNILVTGRGSSTRLLLVDWGLAEFYKPGGRYMVRVASRHFKGPELLLGNDQYDVALDMWSAGCVLAGLLFKREPFFRGNDHFDRYSPNKPRPRA